jgi:two-component system sensor histidine kinase UhpB
VPQGARDDVASAQKIVQMGLEDIRRIARDLRPEALDDLGLASALAALAERFARQARLHIDLQVEPALPQLHRDAELVIYRVAQEALTNVARHSGSATAALRLVGASDRVTLTVTDDGSGLPPEASGGGLLGMAERASTIEAALWIGSRDGGGTEIRLDVPIQEEGLWYR